MLGLSRFFGATILVVVSLLAIALGRVVGREPLACWQLCAGAGVLGAYLLLLGLGVALPQMSYFGQVVCHGPRREHRVAFTFDDGPDPSSTPQLLDLLQEEGVPVAFFCTGRRVQAYPDLVQRIVAEGHLVGNHSHRHAWWTNFLFGPWLRREIEAAQQAIASVTGSRPIYFRSPMGLSNPHLPGALNALGLLFVGWDVRGRDQRARSAHQVIARVLRGTRAGSIIALHDGDARPSVLLGAVQGLIRELRGRGLGFARLDELIDTEHG